MLATASSTTPAQNGQQLVHAGRITEALAILHTDRDPSTTTLALLLDCLLARGEMELALQIGERLTGREDPTTTDEAQAAMALGGLAAATGRDEEAVLHFRSVERLDDDPVTRPWRAGAALSLLRTGHGREAADLAHEHLELVRATGAAYAVADALRTTATCCLVIDRAERLREAHALAHGSFARLAAQVATDLAGVLALTPGRTERDEAVSLLRAAEEYADAEDLWPLHSRIRRLLQRLGETPQVPRTEILARLTDSELRVARLAARGGTNRAIAAQVGASVKAVEWHLSHAYRKLGIRGRAELPQALRLG